MGLMTTVTNIATQKKYFVSTVEEPRVGGWQTAVYRKIFGPLANFRKPAFFLGGSVAERAANQHERVATIVRDVDPANWEEASRVLSMELIEQDVLAEQAEHASFHSEISRMFK
jgi:hypothetical protein